MDLSELRPGDRVRTVDGAEAEIVNETEDGQWIKVRYVGGADPDLIGTEDLCHEGEIERRIAAREGAGA